MRFELLGRRSLLVTALAAAGMTSVHALDLPDLVAQSKPSVVLVGTFGVLDAPRFSFHGTGFVVGDGHHVLTNAHVIAEGENPPPGERAVTIETYGPDGQWTRRNTEVEKVDPEHDLALLRFDGPAVPALQLAAAPAREGTEIALIGFPLGGALGFSHVTHHGIVAAKTSIALPAPGARGLTERVVAQIREGTFEVLQLDATAYPGNSGGPVIDIGRDEVIGVVSMVLVKGTKDAAISHPTGITYALPISLALPLLAPNP